MTLMQWQQVDDVWEPYLVVNDQLRITPFRLQDVKDYHALNNTPKVAANSIRNRGPYPLSKAEERVKQVITTQAPLIARLHSRTLGHEAPGESSSDDIDGCPFDVMRLHPSGALIGTMTLYKSDKPLPTVDPSNPATSIGDLQELDPSVQVDDVAWDVGYNMHPEYEGRGWTKAACASLCEWAKEGMGLRHIGAGARASNSTSHAVLMKCGFHPCYAYTRTLPAELGGASFPAVKFVKTL